jgi:hypothetical protein
VDRFIAEMLGRGSGDLPPQLSVALDRGPRRATRHLRLYDDYSREEVHDVFAPDTVFTPQSGTWGIRGIVPIPDRPGDFVFFVTLGQEQAGHVFDEGITEDGVLTWQSQPRQGLSDPQIREFVAHDDLKNSIYLFLRINRRAKLHLLGQTEVPVPRHGTREPGLLPVASTRVEPHRRSVGEDGSRITIAHGRKR